MVSQGNLTCDFFFFGILSFPSLEAAASNLAGSGAAAAARGGAGAERATQTRSRNQWADRAAL